VLSLASFSPRYRKYRINNPYSNPLLHFTVDAGFFIVQLALLAFALVVALKFFESNKKPRTPTQPTIAAAGGAASPAIAEIEPKVSPIAPVPVAKLPGQEAAQTIDAAISVTAADWVQAQQPNQFTIQFGTSPDFKLLMEQAETFAGSESVMPMSIFAFKLSLQNNTGCS